MDFVGTGKKLAAGDVGRAARQIGIPTAALLSFMEVETNGRGFDTRNRPVILFEPHRFYKELGATPSRALAVKQGLAYQSWGTKPYPKSMDERYDQIKRASAISEDAALKSASWGLPQILGSNHDPAGYPGPVPMVEDYKLGEFEQLQSMCRLLAAWGIPRMLQGKDLTDPASWEGPASKYNGSGFRKNAYHERLAASFKKHKSDKDDGVVVPYELPLSYAVTVRLGQKGEAVMNMQNDLKAAGYDPFTIDGRFGPKTEDALKRFQTDNKLTADGVYGEKTRAKMKEVLGKLIPTAPEPPTDNWPQQKPRNWLAQLIDAILDIVLGLFTKG